jgi:TRAP-type C4-dicarboxylate transport system substrate-binding protein
MGGRSGCQDGGNLTVEVFHSAQLGVEEDIIEQIKLGSNVGQNIGFCASRQLRQGHRCHDAPYFVASSTTVLKLGTLET